MTRHHTREEVRRFDLFKLIVTLLLIALLIVLLAIRALQGAPTTSVTAPEAESMSEPSAEGEAEVEVEAPIQVEVPALTSPTEDTVLSPGELTLTGTGQPGSEVQIVVDGNPVGTTTVSDDGEWTFTTEVTQPGEHEINLQTVDDSGEVLGTSAPALFVVALPAVEAVAPTAPKLDFPASGEVFPTGELTLSGTGEPGTEIEILDNGDVIGTIEVDASGGWHFTVQPDEGVHQYAARPVGGETSVSNSVSVTVTTPPAEQRVCSSGILTGDTYIVGSCETLSEVALRTDTTVEALLAANPQIEDPDRIYAGQVIKVPR